MKHTTYIFIALLLAGALLIAGILLVLNRASFVDPDKYLMTLDGNDGQCALPDCQSIAFRFDFENERGNIINIPTMPLDIVPAETDSAGSLSYPADLERYMTIQGPDADRRLTVRFRFPKDSLPAPHTGLEGVYIRLKSPLRLALPKETQAVTVTSIASVTTIKGLERQSFTIDSQSIVSLENCRFDTLSAIAAELKLDRPGKADYLYLDMDRLNNLSLNPDSFHIQTECVTGGGVTPLYWQPKDSKTLRWIPKNKHATLQLNLEQAAHLTTVDDTATTK